MESAVYTSLASPPPSHLYSGMFGLAIMTLSGWNLPSATKATASATPARLGEVHPNVSPAESGLHCGTSTDRKWGAKASRTAGRQPANWMVPQRASRVCGPKGGWLRARRSEAIRARRGGGGPGRRLEGGRGGSGGDGGGGGAAAARAQRHRGLVFPSGRLVPGRSGRNGRAADSQVRRLTSRPRSTRRM
eukprot:scaffold3183_cov120-Isochrysis_galbana.AAC.4